MVVLCGDYIVLKFLNWCSGRALTKTVPLLFGLKVMVELSNSLATLHKGAVSCFSRFNVILNNL